MVLTITAGLLLLVAGETRFDLTGFVLVMTAAMLAGLRWTITQVLLQGDPSKAHGEGRPGCEGGRGPGRPPLQGRRGWDHSHSERRGRNASGP